jgi:hypothetical protein
MKIDIPEMKNPGFYCEDYIETHNNIKMYRGRECTEQCHTCMDKIIDHHFDKKVVIPESEANLTDGKPFKL